MKKIISAALLLFAFSAILKAEDYALTPGMYAVIDGKMVALQHENASVKSWDPDITGGYLTTHEIAQCVFRYKKPASKNGTCPGKFVMVCDPNRKAIVMTIKSYKPFIATMNPENMMLIRLDQAGKRRVYDATRAEKVSLLEYAWPHEDFQWKQIDEYTYEIDATALPAGEYGFIFRISDKSCYRFDAAFTFTK